MGEVAGGDFESDEFSPNFPQLGRRFKGKRFNSYYKETANYQPNPMAKNPGVNAAIADPPPDMRLEPPMRGEVDKNDMGRNKQYKGQTYLPSWKNPRNSSHGDLLKGKNPNY
jgi:hypothetical protein